MMDYKMNIIFAEIVVSKNRRSAFKGRDDPSVKFSRIIISEQPERFKKYSESTAWRTSPNNRGFQCTRAPCINKAK